ncbi:MAG: glycosyltransferase family 4 protein [Nanoarchaeota archaeon]|nr:glycosyltransferase family 4 protein [Nanoarchaeota archaeon]
MINLVYGYLVKHGGIGRYISEVLSNSSMQKDIELITIENNLQLPKGTKITKIDCNRNRQFLSISENLSFSQKVEEIVKNADIIHSHGVYKLKPKVYTAHICLQSYFDAVNKLGGGELPDNIDEIISLERDIVMNCGLITAVSGKVADSLALNYNLDKENILLIKGASRFRNVFQRKVPINNNGNFRIGFIGGNLKAKGLHFLLGAVNILKNKGYNPIVIGAGTNQDIEKYFKETAKFNFELKGKIDIGPDFYEGLDAYVCPSMYEAYSLSTLEAMALEVPVVSSNLNGVFYDNPDEFLARVSDISNEEELAEIIKKTCEDKDFRERTLTSGRNISSQYSWESISKEYDKLYSSI